MLLGIVCSYKVIVVQTAMAYIARFQLVSPSRGKNTEPAPQSAQHPPRMSRVRLFLWNVLLDTN